MNTVLVVPKSGFTASTAILYFFSEYPDALPFLLSKSVARNESFWWLSETPEAADLGVSTSFEVYNLGPRPH